MPIAEEVCVKSRDYHLIQTTWYFFNLCYFIGVLMRGIFIFLYLCHFLIYRALKKILSLRIKREAKYLSKYLKTCPMKYEKIYKIKIREIFINM